jgi:GNAT superfamily N-acetyltransferase
MNVALTLCTPPDQDLVFAVTEAAMRPYVEQAFGPWDADEQRRRSDEAFDPATYRRIVVDGEPAGILVVEDRPSEIFLAKVFLLPAFQRRRIGSTLITALIDRAQAEGKPLRLRVLRVNSAARRLYERLGFKMTESTPGSRLSGVLGARWIVEGVRAGEHWVIDRWSPNPGPLRDLGRCFHASRMARGGEAGLLMSVLLRPAR